MSTVRSERHLHTGLTGTLSAPLLDDAEVSLTTLVSLQGYSGNDMGAGRQTASGITVCIICGLIFVYITLGSKPNTYFVPTIDVGPKMKVVPVSNYSDIVVDMSPKHRGVNIDSPAVGNDALEDIRFKRVRTLDEACANASMLEDAMYVGRFSLFYFLSRRYNFSYCKVPKAGCTFWTQLFHIIEKPRQTREIDIFAQARSNIHGSYSSLFKIAFDNPSRKNSRTVLVSRNPYSRLYSAYVDKMFLPLMWGSADSIGLRALTKKGRNGFLPVHVDCPGKNVSFNDFLDYIIESAQNGRTLNRHWAPIFSLCKPCSTDYFFLVKQETFAKDVEYVLDVLQVAQDDVKTVKEALHSHRITDTLPGIIATVLAKGKSARNCLDSFDVAQRIWRSFQIQGYIKDDVDLPISRESAHQQQLTSSYLTEFALQAIQNYPLDHDESSAQRQKFLVDAYKDIREDTIENLKRLYYPDFKLFGYSFEPPH